MFRLSISIANVNLKHLLTMSLQCHFKSRLPDNLEDDSTRAFANTAHGFIVNDTTRVSIDFAQILLFILLHLQQFADAKVLVVFDKAEDVHAFADYMQLHTHLPPEWFVVYLSPSDQRFAIFDEHMMNASVCVTDSKTLDAEAAIAKIQYNASKYQRFSWIDSPENPCSRIFRAEQLDEPTPEYWSLIVNVTEKAVSRKSFPLICATYAHMPRVIFFVLTPLFQDYHPTTECIALMKCIPDIAVAEELVPASVDINRFMQQLAGRCVYRPLQRIPDEITFEDSWKSALYNLIFVRGVLPS